MDFCANIFNYSELVSTIVFHHKWNLTSSSSFMEHKILSDFDDNVSSIRNTAWMLANGKYVFSLAVVMAILLRFRLTLLKQQDQLQQQAFSFANFVSTVKLLHWNRCDYPGILFSLTCFIAFMILLPLLVVTWLCVLCYRQYIYFIIRKKYGERFRGFLEGTDAVWALEDDSAKSVINVMALVEIGAENTEYGSVNVLLALRKRFALRFLGEYKPFPKLFYKRCKEYGYSFWTNGNKCTIEDHIRFMPDVQLNESPRDDKSYIEATFGVLCNMPLPCEHSASWEILVSKRYIMEYTSDSDGEKIAQVPILFRIHHSLGDGVALLRLFLETIADRDPPKKDLWSHCIRVRQELKKYLDLNMNLAQLEAKTPIWRSLLTFDINEFRKLASRLRKSAGNLIEKVWIFVSSPASIVNQALFKSIDENSLHRKTLSGEKLVCWRFENDDDHNLLDTMKSIKRNFQGVRFSDVLLSAISISFQNYFEMKGNHIPNTMTVVLPARIEAEGAKLQLQNKFSVALQTLPIQANPSIKSKNKAARFHAKMFEVKKYSDQLHSSPDYYVNYWIMSFLTALLPESALSSLTESVHSTIAVSNLPGPQMVTYINGYRISNLTFWLPHRGSTGIGISILSYGNKLQLGLIADRAVISNQADAQSILDNTADEIRHMATRKNYNLKRNSVGDIIDRF